MSRPFDPSLYFVTDPLLCSRNGLAETVLAAIRGGATLIQLRDKTSPDEAFIAVGKALKQALAKTGVPLIVNDRIETVDAIGADGLHIGQSDISPREARSRLGPEPLLGLSIETLAQALQVEWSLIDYVGAGPVSPTPTKADHAAPVGFDGLRAIVKTCPVPVVAIGGLGLSDVKEILRTGAAGLAVVSAIAGVDDPEAAARALRQAIDRERS